MSPLQGQISILELRSNRNIADTHLHDDKLRVVTSAAVEKAGVR